MNRTIPVISSSLPNHIRKDNMSFPGIFNDPKFRDGPTNPKPGPTPPMVVATDEIAEITSNPTSVIMNDEKMNIERYAKINTPTPLAISSEKITLPTRMESSDLGWPILLRLLDTALKAMMNLAVFMAPEVDPVIPPISIATTIMNLERGGHWLKSSVV